MGQIGRVGEGAAADLRLRSTAGRGVLLAAVLGSGMAFLDATVVNVALPHIGRDLNASLDGLQWTVSAYTLTLAAFVLLGGALGDRFGRRRVFLLGVLWFAVASAACGLAQSIGWLIVARAVQGTGAALLTPGSLALMEASFHPDDRGRAIGAWSGLSGVSTAVGPFLGGWLIDAFSWRWIFYLNLPLAAAVIAASIRWVPESRDPSRADTRFDVAGATLGAVGLAGVTYALIEAAERGFGSWLVLSAIAVGVAGFAAFVLVERRRGARAMLPLGLFSSKLFSALNVYTVAVYAALSGMSFFLVVFLQNVVGLSALAAGAALLPATILLLIGSAPAGRLATRIGPRIPVTIGPLLAAVGLLMLRTIGPHADYWLGVLPGTAVFGLGLTLLVAPLTAAVLGAVGDRFAGVASGVNNAAARAGGLLAVAALPLLVGMSGTSYEIPAELTAGFRAAMLWCAGLLVVGALLAAVAVPRRARLASAPA
ncbi:MAG TPA: DHA2 family efflux MFS transporter permease subunit [Micromonosporaceae bacterium]|jgi:EmrB/QacA subfamily drug resistance transporter